MSSREANSTHTAPEGHSLLTPSMFEAINILGQRSQLRIYTQITLGYETPGDYHVDDAVSVFKAGLARLAACVPWLAGSIEDENGVTGISSTPGETISLAVEDMRQEESTPCFAELKRMGFPARFFSEKHFCSKMTIPGTHGETLGGDEPVFLVQLNIVDGGIFLSFIASHAVLDMVGQASVMRLLCELCDPSKKPSHEALLNTQLKRSTIPIIPDTPSMAAAEELFIQKPISVAPEDLSGAWRYFDFTKEKLERLKTACAKEITETPFISTDDCLCALICKTVTRARSNRVDPSRHMKFARAVDARSLFEQDPHQIGVCLNMTFNRWPIREVTDQPLGVLASQLRGKLSDRVYLRETVMVFGSMLSRAGKAGTDGPLLSMAGTVDPSVDVQISSWSKLDCYENDFNLGLGNPTVVLRPTFVPVPGLVYFLPRRSDGGVSVTLCLRDDDMTQFVSDPLLLLYGTPIE